MKARQFVDLKDTLERLEARAASLQGERKQLLSQLADLGVEVTAQDDPKRVVRIVRQAIKTKEQAHEKAQRAYEEEYSRLVAKYQSIFEAAQDEDD